MSSCWTATGLKVRGDIPSYIQSTRVASIFVVVCCSSGSIPMTLREVPMKVLWVYSNQLSGDFPDIITNTTLGDNLVRLDITGNRHITGAQTKRNQAASRSGAARVHPIALCIGTLPDSIWRLTRMWDIAVGNNQMTGGEMDRFVHLYVCLLTCPPIRVSTRSITRGHPCVARV